MRKEPQPFPRDEYLARLSAVKLDIGKREIDVLFVTDPSNITYLSDYTPPKMEQIPRYSPAKSALSVPTYFRSYEPLLVSRVPLIKSVWR